MDNIIAGFFKKTSALATFEDVQTAIRNADSFIIINTMPMGEQECLIKNTMSCYSEETVVNQLLYNYDYNEIFIVYGKNTLDDTSEKKAKQLISLGFNHTFIYKGGMFEWLLLQDIYGDSAFPTTMKILDILKYKPHKQIRM
jgi:hypothetical protein